MIGKEERINNSAFGHVCQGTSASIDNSPINITLNINIVQADTEKVESLVGKILNMVGIEYGYSGKRLATIENAQRLSEAELQGSINSRFENR